MKRTIRHIISAFALCLIVFQVQADIGETHQLKQERGKLEFEIKQLMSDSAKNAASILQMQNQILDLDARIFESYDETVDRLAAQKTNQTANNRFIVYLALSVSFIALFLAVMLFVVRSRVMEKGNSGLLQFYRELSMEFAGKVSPEKTGANRMLRVNVVVLAGLILMGVSILAYLIKSL